LGLATPQSVRTLQRKLYVKAKEEPRYRFYSLYDKVWRGDVLLQAYRLARSRKGAPGVDGVTFEQVESDGLTEWMRGLQESLRTGTYRPQPVRRVYIPKPNGGQRPLGIPTIRDRVVQTAAVLVLAPIFEAEFAEEMYARAPGGSGPTMCLDPMGWSRLVHANAPPLCMPGRERRPRAGCGKPARPVR